MTFYYGYKDKLSDKLGLSGGKMSGSIDMGNNVIEVGYTPTKKSHVTNKQYVDESIKDHTLFSRIWHYSTISSTTKYPMAQRSGWTTVPIYCSKPPTSHVYIDILSLISDNDGGGLDDTDSIVISIKYLTDDGSKVKTRTLDIKTINIVDYKKYSISDQ